MNTDILVVALGNPGKKYALTRHNVGWMAADELIKKGWGRDDSNVMLAPFGRVLLLKPLSMMNNSGQDLVRWLRTTQIGTADLSQRLWVMHDDLDFEPGQVREQFDRSAAGHNGVQSIIDALGTQAFHRLRIGVGSNRQHGVPSEDYVLQPLTPDERMAINPGLTQAADIIRRLAGR